MSARARYGHPLRFYIRPHFVKRPPVAALKLRLVPAAAARPTGLQNRPYAKWPELGRFSCVSAWHCPGAARSFPVSGLRPVATYQPRPPQAAAPLAPSAPMGLPHTQTMPSAVAPHRVPHVSGGPRSSFAS